MADEVRDRLRDQQRELDARIIRVAEAYRPGIDALIKIARGRLDCGRPLDGDAARDLARRALVDMGVTW